jgi:hypothetical protein
METRLLGPLSSRVDITQERKIFEVPSLTEIAAETATAPHNTLGNQFFQGFG